MTSKKTPSKEMTSIQRERQRMLLAWFVSSGRDFPWRHRRTPYRVLVAELMLQQTQADRVVSYFKRFTRQFPTFASLARADQSQVLALWSGLGYNRRALYLHRTAKEVVSRFHGRFPKQLEAIRTLPGIGPYTAQAILSFSFNKPSHAEDVNVLRVASRILGEPTQDSASQIAFGQYEHPAAMLDALMDIGATICKAREARCQECPLERSCATSHQPIGQPIPFRTKTQAQRRSSAQPIPRRLIRGQILSMLVASQRPTTILSLQTTTIKRFPQITPEAFVDALETLAKDGFTVRKRNSIELRSQSSDTLVQ